MAYDEALAERIRDRLSDADGVVEKKMFGGHAFVTHGNMTVGVHGDDLIARVDAAGADSLLTEPGARPFDITGRPVRGWVLVAGEVLDDDVLERWIDLAATFVRSLPPK